MSTFTAKDVVSYNKYIMNNISWLAPTILIAIMASILLMTFTLWRDVGNDVDRVESKIDNVEARVIGLEKDMVYVKDDIREIKSILVQRAERE